MRFKKIFIILIFFLLTGVVFLFGDKIGFLKNLNPNNKPGYTPTLPISSNVVASPASTKKFSPPKASPTPTVRPSPPPANSVLLDVPFAAQAPYGEWDITIFQNACEEASIMLASHWVFNQSLNFDQAKAEIINLSDFETQQYGYLPYDLSAADTAKLFKDYYNYDRVSVKYGIGAPDIISELAKGNLVIVPVDGQKLGNPFYTPPGPERHTLVIIGYDYNIDEFITDDVGTRHGQNYRYQASVLDEALRDYPTGIHLPIVEITKAMIVIQPKI